MVGSTLEDYKVHFSNEIWKLLKKLTEIMEQMEKELKPTDDSRARKCLRVLASSQNHLLKAVTALNPSCKILPIAGESWEHHLAKNRLVENLSVEHFSVEFSFGEYIWDVLAKIGEDYVIIEAQTDPSECTEKARKLKTALADLVSKDLKTLESEYVSVPLEIKEIKKDLERRKPLRLIFAVTRRPNTSTLMNIKKEESDLIHPEVHYVEKLPPYEISPNLLEKIQI